MACLYKPFIPSTLPLAALSTIKVSTATLCQHQFRLQAPKNPYIALTLFPSTYMYRGHTNSPHQCMHTKFLLLHDSTKVTVTATKDEHRGALAAHIPGPPQPEHDLRVGRWF